MQNTSFFKEDLASSELPHLSTKSRFLASLFTFLAERRVPLSYDVSIAGRPVCLCTLYRKVSELGGYDEVCKSGNEQWKNIAQSLDLPGPNVGRKLASIYFHYLIAWELKDKWDLTPPHVDLLENSNYRDHIVDRIKALEEKPVAEAKDAIAFTIKDTNEVNPPAASMHNLPSIRSFYENDTETSNNQKKSSTPFDTLLPNNMYFASSTLPTAQIRALPLPSTLNKLTQPPAAATPKLGMGLPGPPLLVRVSLAMKSNFPDEVDWALGHLIKISFERSQEFKLKRLPGLAECLMEGLRQQITRLHYYQHEDTYYEHLDRALAAALVLRNAVLNLENAQHVALSSHVADILELGVRCALEVKCTELLQYILDIAELEASYISITSEKNELYKTLCRLLKSQDRSILIAALRTLARLALNDDNNRLLQDIDDEAIGRVIMLTATEDEEVIGATLDLLYQYTTYRSNTQALLRRSDVWTLVEHLIRLMLFQAQERYMAIHLPTLNASSENTGYVGLPLSELQQLLSVQEPERCIRWMRMCFDANPKDCVLQTDIWQLYCSNMEKIQGSSQMGISPADFIKVSSHAFPNARAMTVATPKQPVEYVINGIRRRRVPLSLQGERFETCLWKHTNGPICGAQLAGPSALYAHVQQHIASMPTVPTTCQWANCNYSRLPSNGVAGRAIAAGIVAHMLTHLPPPPSKDLLPSIFGRQTSATKDFRVPLLQTAVDERGDATGTALTATLVLRNLVRSKQGRILFTVIERRVINISTVNPSIAPYISEMLLGQP
ncbi:RSC complex subunit Rsc9 [Schizosaccharomyces japonicus yFS275]|uniref:RSC complex subunit Rsc9 n=1 Tax=Schizosaccharomyces japonicus (strain yFS275 / FY16936) TaxID=402676 RepID=B6JYG0_SCHJY|nr:RSC complex subunit Rsc9 [Schizosaccharomyces japonicus yFS275]EEB06578.1 RSC complex subunit Rsc9 [Schizosaccharomyces japonicus yFS275]